MVDYDRDVHHHVTDYGFILIYPDGFLEMFGMSGIGRYELFSTCVCEPEDDFDAIIQETLDEHADDVRVFRKTKRLLDKDDEE
jgi:hypothetical protein